LSHSHPGLKNASLGHGLTLPPSSKLDNPVAVV
jgi:hypothetical protein